MENKKNKNGKSKGKKPEGFAATLNAVLEKIKLFFAGLYKKALGLFDKTQYDHSGPVFVPNTKRRSYALSVLFTTIKFYVVAFVLIGCIGIGMLLGIAKAYIETTTELDISQLTKSDRTSFIYDCNGKLITTFAGLEYRDWANADEIPDMLKNALISIEDIRFYQHSGIDYKRLFSAVINTFRNTNTHGGSTLTQQLVKNKLLSNDLSYKRKIQEAYLAGEIENIISKEDIIVAYLNDVFLGGSNYGVKTAASDYFGKSLDELSIRECAMLAGMVQKPYETNPRTNLYKRKLSDGKYTDTLNNLYESEGITQAQFLRSMMGDNRMYITDRRTNIVLLAMYNAGCITKEQYDAAMAEELVIKEKSAQGQIYDMPYSVEYAIQDVVTHWLKKEDLMDTEVNRSAIEKQLRTGGYHIYTTIDPVIQHTVQETLETWDKYPALANPAKGTEIKKNADGTPIEVIQPQAAAVVFDYHTGELRAVVGGRETPTRKKEWNRAFRSALPVGSSIKPLSVYGPALDLGLFPGSVIANMEGPIEGWGGEKGYPAIGSTKWIGPITLRRGVVSSLNVAAARVLLEKVTLNTAADYLVNLGIDRDRINVDGSGLALGTSGITPIEMAAAFGAIANGGEYIEPFAFTRVVDSSGKVVLDANEIRETRRVYKETTAYMLIDILTNAVQNGTGTSAKIKNMSVAGKTGTNSDYSSVCFSGMTPYYSATVWIGHDYPENKLKKGSSGGDYAAPLWQAFMEKIHANLPNKPIMDISPGDIGLTKVTTCSLSGKLATDACHADPYEHLPVTDWVTKEGMPTETCDMHVMIPICEVSGGQAIDIYCRSANRITEKNYVLISSASVFSAFEKTEVLKYIPNAIFTDIPASEYGANHYEPSMLCTAHIPAWMRSGAGDPVDMAISAADAVIGIVDSYLQRVQNLPQTDRETLNAGLDSLYAFIASRDYQQIIYYTEQLRLNYEALSAVYPAVGG